MIEAQLQLVTKLMVIQGELLTVLAYGSLYGNAASGLKFSDDLREKLTDMRNQAEAFIAEAIEELGMSSPIVELAEKHANAAPSAVVKAPPAGVKAPPAPPAPPAAESKAPETGKRPVGRPRKNAAPAPEVKAPEVLEADKTLDEMGDANPLDDFVEGDDFDNIVAPTVTKESVIEKLMKINKHDIANKTSFLAPVKNVWLSKGIKTINGSDPVPQELLEEIDAACNDALASLDF